jgi:hypothetical protein
MQERDFAVRKLGAVRSGGAALVLVDEACPVHKVDHRARAHRARRTAQSDGPVPDARHGDGSSAKR